MRFMLNKFTNFPCVHLGGKETISYGVSAQSGRVIYECSMRGCINNTDIETNEQMEKPADSDRPTFDSADSPSPPKVDDEVIVVRRRTQTVRAIEARTGEERWNFSVGQHELESIRSRDDCHSSLHTERNIHDLLTNLDLRVIVPEGLICAVRKTAPSVVLWKYKFDHPIVNVWKRDEKNELVAIDLFKTVQGMWQFEGKSWTQSTDASAFDDTKETGDPDNMKPSIYIGMFKRQLYIQESEQLRSEQIKLSVIDHMVDEITKTTYARIPWRPIDASSSRLAEIEHESHAGDTSIATTPSDEEETAVVKRNYSATAISVLYGSEYINGDGFYLYAKPNGSDKCNREKTASNKERMTNNVTTGTDRNDTIDKGERFTAAAPVIKFVSLWYWWREIVLIVLTVLVFNVVLTQRRPNQTVS